jgi:hypothetical protein
MNWCTPVIPTLRKWRQENCKLEASLGYIVRPCLKELKETATITKENRGIATNSTETKRTIREFYEQLYYPKLVTLAKMDKFLGT